MRIGFQEGNVWRPRETALITGGARSGKSRFVEEVASAFDRVCLVASAQALDEEMTQRIEEHRKRRPSHWTTIEEPIDLAGAIERGRESDVILVDCITLWLSNLLGQEETDERILERVAALGLLLARAPTRILCVTNEVGQGIVPANVMARRFRDLAGLANQRLASAVSRVYWLVSGIPVRIK